MDLIDPTIAVHHGRIVKRTGDGCIYTSCSMVDVPGAVELYRRASSSATPARRKRIEFLGDVVEESDGDLMGDGVNIAARIPPCSAACSTTWPWPPMAMALSLSLSCSWPPPRHPAQEHRGAGACLFAGSRAACGGEAGGACARAPRAAAPLARRTALRQHRRRSGTGYFVDGVTESLTTDLSRFRRVRHRRQHRLCVQGQGRRR